MGAEVWKYADSLETITDGALTFYLSSDGAASDVFHSGTLLSEKGASPKPDSWVYDPLDNRSGEAEPEENPSYLTSQTGIINMFGQGLIYHSDALPAATEISGFPKVEVTLYEILSDGSSIQLSSANMRARYRESLRQEKPVPPGKAEKYVFDNFTFFSRQVAKGSRLRLVVGSINSPSSEKNYNSGGVVAKETGKDARTAHIQLFHDAEHPSVLELPIVK
jgi:predicted acyl esterase